jgi:hypothetical protein
MLKLLGVITAIFLINISGCIYTDYVGSYNLSRDSENFANRPATSDELNFIVNTIKKIAYEFGFVERELAERRYLEDTNVVDLFKKQGINTQYGNLNGSDSIISVFMFIDPESISISIRDRINTTETDFIKAFKARLENELSKEIDMKKVLFRRRALSLT